MNTKNEPMPDSRHLVCNDLLGSVLFSWKPIDTLDRTKMDFILTAADGAVRTMLWNPRGYWEHPEPAGQIAKYWEPEWWAPIPDVPTLPNHILGDTHENLRQP